MLNELLDEEYEKMMGEDMAKSGGQQVPDVERDPAPDQVDTLVTPEDPTLVRRKRRREPTPQVVGSSTEVDEIGATCPPVSTRLLIPSRTDVGSPPRLPEEYIATTNHFVDPPSDLAIRVLGSVGSKTEVAHAFRMSYYPLVREICSRHIASGILIAEALSQGVRTHQEAKTLRGKDKKFSSELTELRATLSAVTATQEEEVAQLKAELEQTRDSLETEAERARAGMRAAQADSASAWAEVARIKAELEISQKTEEEHRAEFLRSVEFAKMVSGKLTRAVVLGFRGCKDQLKAHGFFPDDKDPDCLDARAVVRSVPEDFMQGP